MNFTDKRSSAIPEYSQEYNGSTQYNPSFAPPTERRINWNKYFFIFVSNWYWFLIAIGITLGIAFFKIRYTIPQYQSAATLIIEDDENSQDVLSEFRSIRYWRRRADLANEIAKIGSFSLALRTVETIDQEIFWTAHGRIRERPTYRNPRLRISIESDSIHWYKNKRWFIDILEDHKRYRFYNTDDLDTILHYGTVNEFKDWRFSIDMIEGGRGHNTYSFVVNRTVNLAKYYRRKIQIETNEEEGTLIRLRSEGPVPEREVDYLNALCRSYIQSGLERKQQIAENTFQFIDEQISVILDSLQISEDRLLAYKITNNVVNLTREGELAYERLRSFYERTTELNLKASYYSYLKKYVEDRKDPMGIIAPTLTNSDDQLLISAVQELQNLYEEREGLEFSAARNNPGIESINDRITGVRLRILEIIDGLTENNNLNLQQIRDEEEYVLSQLKTLPVNEQQLLNIKRKYDLYNQFYTFLLQKRAEAGIQKASTISNVRILDAARYDQFVPVGSNRNTLILIAVLIGILLPTTVFVLRDSFDTRIREREDITNNTDIALLGIIGHADESFSSVKDALPNSSFTESLRRIRTNLQFMLVNPSQKIIMVTSSISGEGKTFTATNLATIIAMNNKKVLLVGCDMRRPSLHKVFNVNNKQGLSSMIIGETSVKEAIRETSITNLSLLPSGPVPPNPAELIETEEMKKIFESLRKKYDYIVLDTPPVALVSDAISLGKLADATLYVVRHYFSHKDVINIMNQLKDEEKLTNVGVVINDLRPSKSFGYNYYYGYSRGYYYGYYRQYLDYYSEYQTD